MDTPQKRTTSNIIADEIIANLKMIGIGLILCAVYLAGFWIYHSPDRKPVSEVEFGQSRYDSGMNYHHGTDYYNTGDNLAEWEYYYSILWLEKYEHLGAPFILEKYTYGDFEAYRNWDGSTSDEMRKRGANSYMMCVTPIELAQNNGRKALFSFESFQIMTKYDDHELVEEAKTLVKQEKSRIEAEKEQWENGINEFRIQQAKNDFEGQLSYSIFLFPLFTIVGRYLIKGGKWVAKNKS